ncbi:hypothetical protein GEOBRER4_n2950 [Citrifermentans bremense]|uniref:Uncharacterized protein n=2 Tax=Geobacteraceae TaxID=213422 RepID=A0ABQ0MF65_9BACT|nr:MULTISPECIES: hypothetical protein [Geobacteraceae]BCG48081.1 hypothetical protein GEOBRER4_n2950 [Citrifermentans bremense]GAW65579.1 hypothetical protein GPEL0_01f0543 [Geoanaerobacter pelophilus]
MTKAYFLLLLACSQVFYGCSNNAVTRGMFEGIRTRNQLQTTPSEQVGKPAPPDYNEFERFRQETTR